MKRHAPFVIMTAAAFLLLFAAISRGSEPVWFDAAVDATPDAVVSESLPEQKEVISQSVSHVTPLRVADCPNGSCRVAVKSKPDNSNDAVDFDDRPRPFRRRGLFRRVFSR